MSDTCSSVGVGRGSWACALARWRDMDPRGVVGGSVGGSIH